MLRNQKTTLTAVIALTLGVATAQAQCTFLIQDTFRMTPRPHGGNGQLRTPSLGDSIASYWPLVPTQAQWLGPNGSGVPNWFFAAASLDPLEVDPQDPYNGVAFIQGSHAALLLPFTAAPTAFTLSFETAIGNPLPAPEFVGYASSGQTSDNFQTFGALWLSMDGMGNWSLFANGSASLVASGQYAYGLLGTGWMHVELTFDPASSMVSGSVGGTVINPQHVVLQLPLSFVGMEAHDNYFNAVNNFLVRTGGATVSVSGPTAAAPGDTVTLTAATNSVDPAVSFWFKDGYQISDGPVGASTYSGSTAMTLTITGFAPETAGAYSCLIADACGSFTSAPLSLSIVSAPCPGDLNGDRTVTLGDLSILLSNYGLTGASAAQGDLNGDTVIDLGDLSALLARYGAVCN